MKLGKCRLIKTKVILEEGSHCTLFLASEVGEGSVSFCLVWIGMVSPFAKSSVCRMEMPSIGTDPNGKRPVNDSSQEVL
jgi:hypothetical protein